MRGKAKGEPAAASASSCCARGLNLAVPDLAASAIIPGAVEPSTPAPGGRR